MLTALIPLSLLVMYASIINTLWILRFDGDAESFHRARFYPEKYNFLTDLRMCALLIVDASLVFTVQQSNVQRTTTTTRN